LCYHIRSLTHKKEATMRKLLILTFLLCAVLVISSCSDSDLPSIPAATRDYQTDAQILSKFVDVNKTIGEYYINENKRNSPLSYISDRDWEELLLVNPLNRAIFEKELAAVNHSLQIAAGRPDVAQIVYRPMVERHGCEPLITKLRFHCASVPWKRQELQQEQHGQVYNCNMEL